MMIRLKSIGHAAVLILVAGTFASTARADGDSGKAVAEALFRDARQLMEAGDVATACPKFAESLSIDRTLGTLLYLGACHEQQGRTASAWSEFSSALTWAQRSGQGERVVFAQKHVEALEPRLAYIIITAPAIPGLQLKVDDAPLSAAAVGTPLPLDPGSHSIEASAPNCVTWHESVTVPAEPGKTPVEVPPLAPAPVAVTPAVTPTTAAVTTTAPPVPTDTGAGKRAGLWTSVAVAGAGVAVGAIFGALTFSAKSSALNECHGNICSQNGLDDINNAKTFATVSTVGFGVAVVGAGVATYFAVTLGSSSHNENTTTTSLLRSVTATPTFSPHEAGFSLHGLF
jgi:hypothetical protein